MKTFTVNLHPKSVNVRGKHAPVITPGIEAGCQSGVWLGELNTPGCTHVRVALFEPNPPGVDRKSLVHSVFPVSMTGKDSKSSFVLAADRHGFTDKVVRIKTTTNHDLVLGRVKVVRGSVKILGTGTGKPSKSGEHTYEDCLVQLPFHSVVAIFGTDGSQWNLIHQPNGELKCEEIVSFKPHNEGRGPREISRVQVA